MILTVIIRDDEPMHQCNSAPTYRSVQIEFTDEQVDKLSRGYYESYAQAFIEGEELNDSYI